jgi:hypothetical protein
MVGVDELVAGGGGLFAGSLLKTTVVVEAGEDGTAVFGTGVEDGAALVEAAGLLVFGGTGFPVKAASIRVVAFSMESSAEAILSTFKFEIPLLIPLYHFFFAGGLVGAAAGDGFDSVGGGFDEVSFTETEAGGLEVASAGLERTEAGLRGPLGTGAAVLLG